MKLKQFKPVHWIYNLLHYKALSHNREAFKKFNVHKPLIASISSRDFPDNGSAAWLDTGNSRELAPAREAFAGFSPAVQSKIASWSDNGYMVLGQFVPHNTCDAVNGEIDRLLKSGAISFTNRNKLMFAYKQSERIAAVARSEELLAILRFLLNREVVLFQTINFLAGSEQRAHSDSIHMTTYPLGYLIAAWLALEDVSPGNGPLFYYPGSHKLPFLLNKDFNPGATKLTPGKKNYIDYENIIEEQIRSNGLLKTEFYARKGDLLIWHANLLHGGAPILDKQSTRKSMVMHYYAKDVIKYHDITERPSLLDAD